MSIWHKIKDILNENDRSNIITWQNQKSIFKCEIGGNGVTIEILDVNYVGAESNNLGQKEQKILILVDDVRIYLSKEQAEAFYEKLNELLCNKTRAETESKQWVKSADVCVICGKEHAPEGQLVCGKCKEKIKQS